MLSGEHTVQQILEAYLITFGWAIVVSIAMGFGIIIAIRMFDYSTKDVDEWGPHQAGQTFRWQ